MRPDDDRAPSDSRNADGSGAPPWLAKLPPEGWIREALSELSRAEALLRRQDRRAAIVGLKRAAGMALNGALAVRPRAWGRTYVDHLRAVADAEEEPAEVRNAAGLLGRASAEPTPSGVVRLTPPSESAAIVEAAKTVMAHAYAIVHGEVGRIT